MSPLRRFEREALCAVMEDCVDQLAVLGGIVPNYAEKPSAVDVVSARQSVSLIVWLAVRKVMTKHCTMAKCICATCALCFQINF